MLKCLKLYHPAQCKHGGAGAWVCCPLLLCVGVFFPSWVFSSSLWLTWFSACSQLVSGDGAHTDAGSVADSLEAAPPLERTGGIGDSRPPSYQSVYAEDVELLYIVCAAFCVVLAEQTTLCVCHEWVCLCFLISSATVETARWTK